MNAAWDRRTAVVFVLVLRFISAASAAIAQPAIIATISPPPNEFGWNNTPVVVSFHCQRALDCPAPLPVEAEGLRQLVRRSVSDADGRTAAASVEISIEFTPPKIAIVAPESDLATRSSAIDVNARVTRSIAEIAMATCNGDRVTVLDSDAIGCPLALRDGINDVVVQITDRAGNSASTGIQIHRVGTASSIVVIPDVRTMRVGEKAPLQVADNFGRTIAAPTWIVGDGSIASIADDTKSLTALAPGSTTITARAGSLEASMVMHVVAGEKLPLGSIIWSVADLPGYREPVGSIITAQCGGDMPDMISIQRGESRRDLVLRAITDDGSQLWIEWPAVSPGERIGDQLTGDPACTGMFRVEDRVRRTSTIVRVGRPMHGLGTLWRYTPLATLGPEFSVFDESVNVVETPDHGFPVLVRIDRLTGSPKRRILLPHSASTIDGTCSADREAPLESPADVSDSTVLVDGDVNLAVSTVEAINDSPRCPRATARWTRTVEVLQVLSDGSVSIRRVFEYPSSNVRVEVQLHKVLPDGHGGRLVMWKERTQGRPIAYRGVRVIDDRLILFDLATLGETILAEEDMGVTTDGQTITGFDVPTGQPLWVLHAGPGGHFGQLRAAGGGGFQVRTERGFEFIDRAGRRSIQRD